MIVFNTDLDNTIIFSKNKTVEDEKICVELLNGEPLSYMTLKMQSFLRELNKRVLIVPTTTRRIDQYKRINMDIGDIKYALTCNGGVLLVNGKIDTKWYEDSLNLIKDSRKELLKAVNILKEYDDISILKFIEEMFVFIKSDEPEKTEKILLESVDLNLVDVFKQKKKLYAVPKELSKGKAIKRFKDYIAADQIISSGDSEMDISMLLEADKAVAPYNLKKIIISDKNTSLKNKEIIYSKDRNELENNIINEINSMLKKH